MLGAAAEYGPVMHRLTDLADLLIEGNYIAIKAAGGKARKPKPIRRPEPESERERQAKQAEEAAYVRRLRAERQAQTDADAGADEATDVESADADWRDLGLEDAQEIAESLTGANGSGHRGGG